MLRSPQYGLPPPPVPRIQAPIASDSISSAETGRREAMENRDYRGVGGVFNRAGTMLSSPRSKEAIMNRLRFAVVVAMILGFVASVPSAAFERVGDKKILVFAGA